MSSNSEDHTERHAIIPLPTLFDALKAAATRRPSSPMAKAHRTLVEDLALIAVPHFDVCPEAEQFEDVADYMLRVAAVCDRWLLEIGQEIKANATEGVDLKDFTEQFRGALEGNATFYCDRNAEALRHEQDEIHDGGGFAERTFDHRSIWSDRS